MSSVSSYWNSFFPHPCLERVSGIWLAVFLSLLLIWRRHCYLRYFIPSYDALHLIKWYLHVFEHHKCMIIIILSSFFLRKMILYMFYWQKEVYPMMQKMLSRFFSLRELLSECSHSWTVFELWRGQKWKHCCGTAGCPEEEVSVPLQGPLSRPPAFRSREACTRRHTPLTLSSPAPSPLLTLWQLSLGIPISVDSRCVLRGIRLKTAPMRNWKLQLNMLLFLMASSLFLVCQEKVEVELYCELGCGVSSWSARGVLPSVNLCFTISNLDMTASAS